MTVEIENMNLTLQLREEYETRLTFEKVLHKPTKVDVEWDGEEWVLTETLEEEEAGRTVMRQEVIATGHNDPTFASFEEAVLKLNYVSTKLDLATLKLIAKAFAHGFEQPGNTLSPMARREIVDEFAHSMNRKKLIDNDDIGTFTADILAELKSS